MKLITTSEIHKHYPSLKKYGDLYTRILYNDILKEQVITEMLNSSIDKYLLIKLINKKFNVVDLSLNGDDEFELNINYGVYSNVLINDINNELLKLGYFISYCSFYKFTNDVGVDNCKFSELGNFNISDDTKFIIFKVEPKYDVEVDVSNFKYLYHITFDCYYESKLNTIKLGNKIQDVGLTPKTKSKLSNHPERVYLLTDKDSIIGLANALYRKTKSDIKKYIKKIYILKIDTTKISNIKFYNDPNMEDAVWTFQNIPPLFIEVDELIEI
jgi:hypothetical protein